MRLESLLLVVVVMLLGNGTALAVEPPASSGSSEWPLLGRTAEIQITPEELQALQYFILDEAWNSYEKQPAESSAGH